MLLIILRILHIVAGVIWVGGAIVLAEFVLPSIKAAGPAGGAVMRQIVEVRKVPMIMTNLAWLTVVAGFALYYLNMRGSANNWGASATGMTFGIGGILAVIAVIIGATVSKPAADKLGALGAQVQSAGGPPTPEQVAAMQALQAKLTVGVRAAALFAVLAALVMSIARYV